MAGGKCLPLNAGAETPWQCRHAEVTLVEIWGACETLEEDLGFAGDLAYQRPGLEINREYYQLLTSYMAQRPAGASAGWACCNKAVSGDVPAVPGPMLLWPS